MRPEHVLVNYFAAVTEPQTTPVIEGSLAEIVRDLSEILEGGKGAQEDVLHEFEHWGDRHLIKHDQSTDLWGMTREMAANFASIADGFNRELDPADLDRLRAAIMKHRAKVYR